MGVLPDDWTLPALTPLNREWFTSGSIAVQTCAGCGELQHPPEEICHRCGGMAFGTTTLEPSGTVHSYTVAHYPVHPALADSVPYAIVLVALDDAPGIRVIGNLLGVPPSEVRVGQRVTATWERRLSDEGEEVLLPQWQPAP